MLELVRKYVLERIAEHLVRNKHNKQQPFADEAGAACNDDSQASETLKTRQAEYFVATLEVLRWDVEWREMN